LGNKKKLVVKRISNELNDDNEIPSKNYQIEIYKKTPEFKKNPGV